MLYVIDLYVTDFATQNKKKIHIIVYDVVRWSLLRWSSTRYAQRHNNCQYATLTSFRLCIYVFLFSSLFTYRVFNLIFGFLFVRSSSPLPMLQPNSVHLPFMDIVLFSLFTINYDSFDFHLVSFCLLLLYFYSKPN